MIFPDHEGDREGAGKQTPVSTAFSTTSTRVLDGVYLRGRETDIRAKLDTFQKSFAVPYFQGSLRATRLSTSVIISYDTEPCYI